MFETGKILWFLVHPSRVAFYVLCLGGVLLFTRRWRAGRALLALLLTASIALSLFPVGEWVRDGLESRFPRPLDLPAHVDGVVMLGGDIDAERTLETGLPVMSRNGRLLAFADLARRYPEARLAFSGGSGNLLDRSRTEADAMPIVLRAVGLDPARVIFEGKSRSTHENAVFTRALVEPKPGETWLLITDAWHMPRAVGSFRQAGFPVTAYPVGFNVAGGVDRFYSFRFDSGFGALSNPLKECLGLIAYRLAGYTDALLPGP